MYSSPGPRSASSSMLRASSAWRITVPTSTNRPPGENSSRLSGRRVRIASIAANTRCWPALVATPRSAASAAGSSSERQGSEPYRPCTAAIPATTPGTAQAAGPAWKTCVVCSSNGTSTSSTSVRRRPGGRSRPGMDVNASSSAGARPRAGRTRKNPPPHGPVRGGSAAHDMAAAATAASTALPPRDSTSAPGAGGQLVAGGDRSVHRDGPTARSWAARADRPAAPASARREPRRDASPGQARARRSRWRPPSPTSGRPAARRPMRRR